MLDLMLSSSANGALTVSACRWAHALAETCTRSPATPSASLTSQDACQQFANSVSSLPPDDAERVGRDPGGSRVLEALVTGAASAKQKARLLRALHGRWAGLAAEFGGSHLVEKCFAAAVRTALDLVCINLKSTDGHARRCIELSPCNQNSTGEQ